MSIIPMISLGIRHARTEPSLTSQDVADLMDISRESYESIESGAQPATFEWIAAFCHATGAALDDICSKVRGFPFVTPPPPTPNPFAFSATILTPPFRMVPSVLAGPLRGRVRRRSAAFSGIATFQRSPPGISASLTKETTVSEETDAGRTVIPSCVAPVDGFIRFIGSCRSLSRHPKRHIEYVCKGTSGMIASSEAPSRHIVIQRGLLCRSGERS